MSNDRSSFTAGYFDRLYADNPDPWNFADSDYERQKYAATLDALPQRRFQSAFEIGCSIGILTRDLAPRCDALLAIDVAESALLQARQNCAGLDQITFQQMTIPATWPTLSFDLILLSEVLYFLGPDDIRQTAQRVTETLTPGGAVMMIHYIKGTNYPCGGDEAVTIFTAAVGPSIKPLRQYREPEYRLDLLTRSP